MDIHGKTLFLSEDYVNKAIVAHLMQNEEFKASVQGKQLTANVKWMLSKWDNPDYLAAIVFKESTDVPQEASLQQGTE